MEKVGRHSEERTTEGGRRGERERERERNGGRDRQRDRGGVRGRERERASKGATASVRRILGSAFLPQHLQVDEGPAMSDQVPRPEVERPYKVVLEWSTQLGSSYHIPNGPRSRLNSLVLCNQRWLMFMIMLLAAEKAASAFTSEIFVCRNLSHHRSLVHFRTGCYRLSAG